MPAQVYVTKEQIAEIYEAGEDVIITEGPRADSDPGITLDVWIIDEESASSDTHRSLILAPNGDVLGDMRLGDDTTP